MVGEARRTKGATTGPQERSRKHGRSRRSFRIGQWRRGDKPFAGGGSWKQSHSSDFVENVYHLCVQTATAAKAQKVVSTSPSVDEFV